MSTVRYNSRRDIDVRYLFSALLFANEFAGPSWSWAFLDYISAEINDVLIYTDCRVGALVRVLEVYVEPIGPDAFGLLRTGYIRLVGRVGRIFSFEGRFLEGSWINGHWSFEVSLDLCLDSMDYESLYCLPVLIRKEYSFDSSTIIDCLLLRQLKPEALDYIRVGLLKVSLDLKDKLPQEIKWITEYCNFEQCSKDLVTVTLY